MLRLLLVLATTPPDNSDGVGGPDLSWLGPTVTAIGLVLVAIISGISTVWRRRQDRKDIVKDKSLDAAIAVQPKVTDGWEEVRLARAEASAYYNLYRNFENLFYTAFGALRHLARTYRDANPTAVLDKDVADALAIVPPDTTDVMK